MVEVDILTSAFGNVCQFNWMNGTHQLKKSVIRDYVFKFHFSTRYFLLLLTELPRYVVGVQEYQRVAGTSSTWFARATR